MLVSLVGAEGMTRVAQDQVLGRVASPRALELAFQPEASEALRDARPFLLFRKKPSSLSDGTSLSGAHLLTLTAYGGFEEAEETWWRGLRVVKVWLISLVRFVHSLELLRASR